MLNTFNNLTYTVHINVEEVDNIINLISRVPSATDFIIPIDSCHPPEHKLAAVRNLTSRLSAYPMKESYKKLECHNERDITINMTKQF
jgi:hypothetical protein